MYAVAKNSVRNTDEVAMNALKVSGLSSMKVPTTAGMEFIPIWLANTMKPVTLLHTTM